MQEALEAKKQGILEKMQEVQPNTVRGNDTSGDSESKFLGFSKHCSGKNRDEDNGINSNFKFKRKQLRRQVETEAFHSRDAPYLDFRLVRVYTIKPINTEVVRLYNTSDPGCKIRHKGIRAGDQIMSGPHGVFQEEL